MRPRSGARAGGIALARSHLLDTPQRPARSPGRVSELGQALPLLRGRVGASRVETLIARQQVGSVLAQPVEEQALDLAPQVQSEAAMSTAPAWSASSMMRATCSGESLM